MNINIQSLHHVIHQGQENCGRIISPPGFDVFNAKFTTCTMPLVASTRKEEAILGSLVSGAGE